MNRWIRDLLVLPILVGVVLGLFNFLLPKLFEKDKEITYVVEEPTEYPSNPDVGSLNIEVNGEKVDRIFS